MKKSGEKTPISEQAVLGFRHWGLDQDNALLVSALGSTWQPGVNYASCPVPHISPGPGCHCGFNAYSSIKTALNGPYMSRPIFGAIAGAGQVEIHSGPDKSIDCGFRSEQAQILALCVLAPDLIEEEKSLVRLSQRYSVPVFTDKDKFLDYIEIHSENMKTLDDIEVDILKSYQWPSNNQKTSRQIQSGFGNSLFLSAAGVTVFIGLLAGLVILAATIFGLYSFLVFLISLF